MSAMEYSGPDRRRGGPDRRALGEVTRILVVDDHALFRMGIANILGHESGLRDRRRGGRLAQCDRPCARDLARTSS